MSVVGATGARTAETTAGTGAKTAAFSVDKPGGAHPGACVGDALGSRLLPPGPGWRQMSGRDRVLAVSEGEFGRVTRVWGGRCMPLLYDPFLLLGELRGLRRLRGEVVGQAHGRVLELGAGTGLNMSYYSGVERLVLSEPEPGMAKRLEQRLKHRAVSGEVVSANQSTLDLIGEAGLRTTEVGTARWRGMPPIVHPIIYGKAETI